MPDPRDVADITLSDGRTLAFGTFGDPTGTPVLFFHGTPGSHVEAELLHEAAAARAVRLIAPDRPGMGKSTQQPGRTLLGWADDVAELADALGLGRLRLIGYSGGGPFALACGYRLAERIDALVVVSGSAPMDRPESLSGSSLLDRALVRTSLLSPNIARADIALMAGGARLNPRAAVRLGKPSLTVRERAAMVALLDRPPRRDLADFLESVRQGASGPALDFRITALPWGFLPEEVDAPVTWWHGIDDDVVPLHQAQDVVSRLPNGRMREVPGASHLAICVEAAAIVEGAITSDRRGSS